MNDLKIYPIGTASCVQLGQLYLRDGQTPAERLSARYVKCAAVLSPGEFLGWQLDVPCKGVVGISLFGSQSLSTGDLEWTAEQVGVPAKKHTAPRGSDAPGLLYELCLPVAESSSAAHVIGFGAEPAARSEAEWPLRYSGQFEELIAVLRQTGGVLRAVLGPADAAAQQLCRKTVLKTYLPHEMPANEYLGTPVQMRVLLRLPEAPSIRLRTVLRAAIKSAELRACGKTDTPEAEALWNAPLTGAAVLPDYAARILMLEPVLSHPVVGLEVCMQSVQDIPASHKNTRSRGAVTIGRATDITGVSRKITVGEADLRRHYQIVGQTGTGKSTLLATMILSAIEQGHGLTFFDPHGTTIDTVLHALPEQYIPRVRVVHIGDAENPVPLNIWDSGDPKAEERNIADLCELFGDIFNPPGSVFTGPRYERWLATFAKASLAMLGRHTSFESIAVLSQSQDNMLKLCKIILKEYPELVETIKEEYGKDKSSDFHGTLNWYLCKFQRLTSVEQLRKTLGAATNALDFRGTIDTDTVTLIDLASPVIGTQAARIVGTMVMMKLWNAAMTRKERDRTHLIFVDEAALFQTNPMPRMLAESRKFGISMVLCHQHTGQLTDDIRDALEANSANLSAFRLSAKDAARAAVRFDDPSMQTLLARISAYRAITTLSVDGGQTAPFTLQTVPVRKRKRGDEIAAQVEAQSRAQLVEPYRDQRALTAAEILDFLDHPEKLPNRLPDWLREWKKHVESKQQAG